MKMSLSKGKTGKRILALFLALMIPAGSVCGAEPGGKEDAAKATAAPEAVIPQTNEDNPQEAPVPRTGEDGEPFSEDEAAQEKLIRKIVTEEEVTKVCGEVFSLEVRLVDQPEGEEGEAGGGDTENAADAAGMNGEAAGADVLNGQPGTSGTDAPNNQPTGSSSDGGQAVTAAGADISDSQPGTSGTDAPNNQPSGVSGDSGQMASAAGADVPDSQPSGAAAQNEAADGKAVPGTADGEVPAGEDPDVLPAEPLDGEAAPEDTLLYESADPEIAAIEQDESGKVWIRALRTGDTVIKLTAPETDQYEQAEAQVLLHVTPPGEGGVVGDALLNAMSVLPGCNFTAADNVKDGISLKWGKVEGAKGYYLDKSTTGKEPWTRIKTAASADELSFLDKDVQEGTAYYYRMRAFDKSGKEGLSGASKKVVRLVAPAMSVGLAATGTELKWNRVTGCSGYYVYRREASKNDWTTAATITQPGEISWRDTAAGNGATYIYSVRAYKGSSLSDYAGSKSYMRVAAPAVKKFKRKSATKFKLTWKPNSIATGYQIQYAQNGMFVGAKKATVKKAKASSYTLSKLSKNKGYYARIRAYKKVGDTTYYSPWSAAGNVSKSRTAKATPLKKKKKVFELRAQAKQKMYQYDTLQGSCTDGTYAYYLMYNRKTVNCKIVKVKRSNLKVAKVSGILDVAHGNDMTYDSHKKRLVIVHSTGSDPKKLTSVDPKTLKAVESKHVQIPKKLAGGSIADAAGATAFTGVAYSSGRKQYAVLLSHNYNFVLLDANLDPVRYVKASKKKDYVVQGIDATDDYILVAQSPKTSKQKYNIITVYDWDGNYISRINAKKGYEIESIYHVGSKYYAGFYRSYYKTCYKDVEKTVVVDGKPKKKKEKVQYKEYLRDNYVYQIKGI